MSSGEVIDSALSIYQRHGFLFLRRTIAPALLSLTAFEFLTSYVLPGLFRTKDPESLMQQLGEVTYTLLIGLCVAAPLLILGVCYGASLAIGVASADLTGNEVSEEQAASQATTNIPALFRVGLITIFRSLIGVFASGALLILGAGLAAITPESNWAAGLLSLLGVIGISIGGIFFLVSISGDSLAPAVLLVEGLSPKEVSKRSRELMKSHAIHGSGTANLFPAYFLLGFLLLVEWIGLQIGIEVLGILDSSEAFLSSLPYSTVWRDAIRLIPEFLAIWTLVPLWGCIVSVTYYDRRVRLEGLDIDILAKEIGRGRANRFDV